MSEKPPFPLLEGGENLIEALQKNQDWLTQKFPISLTATQRNQFIRLLIPGPHLFAAGAINKAGEIITGEGFTAEKSAAGKYTITLTSELPSEGIMQLTCREGGTLRFPDVTESGKKVFKVEFTNQLIALEDTAFNFFIFG